MPLIAAFAFFIVGAGTATLVIIMAVVVIGIRHEERDATMNRRKAPGLAAWLARRIVGLYVRKPDLGPSPYVDPDKSLQRSERAR